MCKCTTIARGRRNARARGLTLTDVLVTVAVLSLLATTSLAALARIRRLPLPPSYFLFPPDGPTAASGTWVLVTSPNAGECPVSFEWLDTETGLTADSTTMSCEYVLKGAVTHRQVYRRGPYAVPSARNQLYDVTADAVLATGDSVSPL